jgi:hypothetical protein
MTTTKLLTIPAFAKATGLTYWLARELVNRGDIPSVQVGPRKRVDARWVEQWTRGGGQRETACADSAPPVPVGVIATADAFDAAAHALRMQALAV